MSMLEYNYLNNKCIQCFEASVVALESTTCVNFKCNIKIVLDNKNNCERRPGGVCA